MNTREDRLRMVEAGPETPAENSPEFRAQPSKISVRLAAKGYYGLLDFCADAAKVRGKRVTHVEVFRILVELLLEDPDLRARVFGKLRQTDAAAS
jgi:hypothetical protein